VVQEKNSGGRKGVRRDHPPEASANQKCVGAGGTKLDIGPKKTHKRKKETMSCGRCSSEDFISPYPEKGRAPRKRGPGGTLLVDGSDGGTKKSHTMQRQRRDTSGQWGGGGGVGGSSKCRPVRNQRYKGRGGVLEIRGEGSRIGKGEKTH